MRRALVLLVALTVVGGCAVDDSEDSMATSESGARLRTAADDMQASQPMTSTTMPGTQTPAAYDAGGQAGLPPVGPSVDTAADNRSTFALDVDTGSYTLARRYLADGLLPDPALVRTEELVNYFEQDYDPPAKPGLAVHIDGTAVPFLPDDTRVVRVGLQAWEVEPSERKPAALTFVIDVSGSMADGGRLELVKESLTTLVSSLREGDTVAIVVYSDDARLVLEPTSAAERETIARAIAELQPLESTNAEAGLRLGYEVARDGFREGAVNRVVLASDGVANVGATGPEAILAAVAEDAGKGIQLVSVGVGMGTYNDPLMEQLADKGDGFYAYVDGPREAERLFVHDLTGTLQTVAMDAKVQVEFDPARVASYRLLGFENRAVADDQFRDDAVDGGEIGAGHTVTALYEVKLTEGARSGPLATVTLRWADPDTREVTEIVESLDASSFSSSFAKTPPRLQRDIIVAAWGEALRGGPWSQHLSLAGVADNARGLPELLTDDPDLAEFAALTRRAAEL